MFVYVGTFTPSRDGRGEGIHVFRMDPATGALEPVQALAGVESPSFLALHPSRPLLYCNNAVAGGAVSAFAVDPASGRLTFLNQQSSGGAGPAHVSVHPQGDWVFAANYGSGTVAMLPLEADGRLGAATDVVQHAGPGGPVAGRQEGPHAHQIVPSPDGRFVLANDLGLDRTVVYRPDLAAGRLVPNDPPFGQANPGAGPRHLAFHPSGRWLYVINELDSTVTAFAWDAERGAMSPLQTAPTLPAGYEGKNSTAQIVVHPSGRFVYGSNRGHDSIAVFRVDEASGRLTPEGHVPTGGKTPRNFNLDPTGAFLYAANQDSDTVVLFRIDGQTGQPAPTGQVTPVGTPVCVVFREE